MSMTMEEADMARDADARADETWERQAYEEWQRSRYVTAFDRNPIGHWGDESGDKYSAPYVQAGWEAWKASAKAAR